MPIRRVHSPRGDVVRIDNDLAARLQVVFAGIRDYERSAMRWQAMFLSIRVAYDDTVGGGRADYTSMKLRAAENVTAVIHARDTSEDVASD